MKRALVQLVATLAALFGSVVALWFCYAQYLDWRYDRPWTRVARGDTQEQVIACLGKPHRIFSERQTKLAWESDQQENRFDGESVVEFRYIPWSPTGDDYVIGFDKDKHAVSKYRITSP